MLSLSPDQVSCLRNVLARYPAASVAWLASYTTFDRGAVERALREETIHVG